MQIHCKQRTDSQRRSVTVFRGTKYRGFLIATNLKANYIYLLTPLAASQLRKSKFKESSNFPKRRRIFVDNRPCGINLFRQQCIFWYAHFSGSFREKVLHIAFIRQSYDDAPGVDQAAKTLRASGIHRISDATPNGT